MVIMKSKPHSSRIRLVLYKDEYPNVELRPGMKIQVVEVELVGDFANELKKAGARLSDDSVLCTGIIDIGSEAIYLNSISEEKPVVTTKGRVSRRKRKG